MTDVHVVVSEEDPFACLICGKTWAVHDTRYCGEVLANWHPTGFLDARPPFDAVTTDDTN